MRLFATVVQNAKKKKKPLPPSSSLFFSKTISERERSKSKKGGPDPFSIANDCLLNNQISRLQQVFSEVSKKKNLPAMVFIFKSVHLKWATNESKEVFHFKQLLLTQINVSLQDNTSILLNPLNTSQLFRGFRYLRFNNAEEMSLLKAAIRLLHRICDDSSAQIAITSRNIADIMYGLKGLSPEYEYTNELADLLANLMARVKGEVNALDLVFILNGMQSFSSKLDSVRCKLLPALLRLCEKCESATFSSRDGAMMVHGLQHLSSQHATVLPLLTIVTQFLSTCKITSSLNPAEAAMLLNGLQSMCNKDGREVGLFLNEVLRLAASCRGPITALGAGMIGMGLRRMISGDDILPLLRTSQSLLATCNESLRIQDAASLVYGLHGMTFEHDEVMSLAEEIRHLLKRSDINEYPSAQQCAMLAFGVVNLNRGGHHSASTAQMLEFIRVLTPLLARCAEPLTPNNACMVVQSLQEMSSEHEDVRRHCEVVAGLLSTCPGPLTGVQCSKMVHSLKKLSARHSQVRLVVTEVTRLCATCTDALSAESCCRLIFGLREMTAEYSEVRALNLCIVQLLLQSEWRKEDMSQLPLKDVVMMVNGLRRLSSSHPEVLSLIKEVNRKLEAYPVTTSTRLTARQSCWLVEGTSHLFSNEPEVATLLMTLNKFLSTFKRGKRMDGALTAAERRVLEEHGVRKRYEDAKGHGGVRNFGVLVSNILANI